MRSDELEAEIYQAFDARNASATEFSARDVSLEPLLGNPRAWQEISPAFVDPINARELTLQALLYLLPVYMLAVLRYDWVAPVLLLDELYTHGLPSGNSDTAWWEHFRRWNQCVGRLTYDQRRVVKLWLEEVRDSERLCGGRDINEMLYNYWLHSYWPEGTD